MCLCSTHGSRAIYALATSDMFATFSALASCLACAWPSTLAVIKHVQFRTSARYIKPYTFMFMFSNEQCARLSTFQFPL